MRRIKLFQIALLVLVIAIGTYHPAQAASHLAPLYLMLADQSIKPKSETLSRYPYGDLWRWTGTPQAGTLTQITHWGVNGYPILSPDGNYIAYQSAPQVTLDYLNSDASHAAGIVYGAIPLNMWVLNTQTDEAWRVADQPASIRIDDAQYDLVNGITRTLPAWSPDSKQLAWIEADSSAAMSGSGSNNFVPRLMVYSVAKDQTQVLVAHVPFTDYMPPQGGAAAIGELRLRWDKSGIAVMYPGRGWEFEVYDSSGKQQPDFTAGVPISYPRYVWVNDGDQQYIGLGVGSPDDSYFLDPQTGRQVTIDGVVEAYTLQAPDGVSIQIDSHGFLNLIAPGHSPLLLENCEPPQSPDNGTLAISPDGKTVACHQQYDQTNTIYFYDATGLIGQYSTGDKNILAMAWGAMGWRVVHP